MSETSAPKAGILHPGPKVGILHPGKMGVAVAATMVRSGCEVYWVSDGRSPETKKRASDTGLRDAGTLTELCATCPTIVSVCPPEFAEQTADRAIAEGFQGLYLDANAISPQRARAVACKMEAAGIRFVDGGIIGLPPTEPGKTWLHLSGKAATEFVPMFAAGPLETEVLGEEPGKASALKACFAGWTKGTRALAVTLLGAAQQMDVLEDLKRQWTRGGPSFEWMEREILGAAPKAWRFAPEMLEIAATLESAGLPGDFYRGADEVYRRLAGFKNADNIKLDDVLTATVKQVDTKR